MRDLLFGVWTKPYLQMTVFDGFIAYIEIVIGVFIIFGIYNFIKYLKEKK